MNPRNCTVKHDPANNTYGDCVRACIATIIDRDDVPHPYDGKKSVEQVMDELRAYLKIFGYTLFTTGYPGNMSLADLLTAMNETNPGVAYVLMCSCSGSDHAVVCEGGKVFHDPNWYRTQITGPHSNGHWMIMLVGVSK